MLEFIAEFIFEIILEGSVMLVSEKKVPMPIRVIAFLIVVGLFLGISGVFVCIGYSAFGEQSYVAASICFAIALFILAVGIYQIKKELRKRKGDKQHYEKNETRINY